MMKVILMVIKEMIHHLVIIHMMVESCDHSGSNEHDNVDTANVDLTTWVMTMLMLKVLVMKMLKMIKLMLTMMTSKPPRHINYTN